MIEDVNDQISDPTTKPEVATVSVEGPGISITRRVDEAVMSSIIALLFGAPTTSLDMSSGGSDNLQRQRLRGQREATEQSPIVWDDDLTLGEFLDATGAKTFSQKICVTGYYLIKFQGAESFSRDDVKTALTNAHEDMPGNFGRDWSTAAASNLIAAKQGEAGQFYIPRTGRTAVESRFHDAPKRRNTRRMTRKASTSSANEDPK